MKKILTAVVVFTAMASMAFAQNAVTFKVNMGKQVSLGNFDPNADSLYVRGSFNGWSTDNPIPKPAGNDSIWVVTVPNVGASGTSFEYKFMFKDASAGSDVWESVANRTATIDGNPTVLDVVYFDNNGYQASVTIPFIFSVDMELERLSGRFSPANDTLSVNGSFNGWTSLQDIMTPSANPDVYEITINRETFVGEEVQYKYWYTPNVWESRSNRVINVSQDDINTGFVLQEGSFNDGNLSNVINQACTIKFTVNTTNAAGPLGPFSSVDNAIICGSSSPLGWPGGGWPTSDSAVVIRLFDDGTHGDLVAGDKIFSKDIQFPAYTALNTEYKYGINFGLDNNQGSNDNEAGVGSNHMLDWHINYVSATAVDTFGVITVSNLINVVTDVREIDNTVPSTFSMSQNYPNPFNPSTSIRFSIPESGNVRLVVYNAVGQEVAVLVDAQKSAGSYEVSFDATKLPSGIYLYTIQSGNFTQTRKMMLLK
ncbi:MAG: T9SS type A sorting domain-containing protein [Ignavibacteriales bacterium]|nr:hypothetical protein [Ignavibacteriaceae bacterium]MBW7873509.1 T9SS type A sorting domain-containing protein [Ignavibacteria bacterium]MBZ0196699.1 T9SS type A sorting domain-containing protein [Ignavibacteriaceae bacterium]MCZ2142200.1 T9SS type A sorting domain-containing protein [Ignavibacteriales bacterium]WKZ71602.1 MAG: T9SS type A sorting domain-containing protein [Ignavibacteriaceae bacterium]